MRYHAQPKAGEFDGSASSASRPDGTSTAKQDVEKMFREKFTKERVLNMTVRAEALPAA